MKKAALILLILIMGAEEIPRVKIGQMIRVGGIEFTPTLVELRQVKIKKPGWPTAKAGTSENYYVVLTFKMENVTDVQVIDPGAVQGKIKDQFGNIHKAVKKEDICQNCDIIEKIDSAELLPGDSLEMIAIFEAPKIKKAELFTVELSFVKDNKGETGQVSVLFDRSDIKQ